MGDKRRFLRRSRRNLCSRCKAESGKDRVTLCATGTLTEACVEVIAKTAEELAEALTLIGGEVDGNKARLFGAQAVRFWTVEASELAHQFDVFVEQEVVDRGVTRDPLEAHVLVTGGSQWVQVQAELSAGGVMYDELDLREALSTERSVVRLENGSYAKISESEVAKAAIDGPLMEAVGQGVKLEHRDAGQVEGILRSLGSVKIVPGTEPLFQSLLVNSASKIPRRLQAKLRGYQEVGLAWLRFIHDLGSGGILADSMGTGKTVAAIALFCSVQEDEGRLKALVVAPKSVCPNWTREMQKFAPHIRTVHWQGLKRHEKLAMAAKQAEVLITSYTLLIKDLGFFNQLGFSYVVLDEAQAIKNPMSATAKAARKLNALHRLAVTGTPIENRLSEFWSIFEFTSPGLLGSINTFKHAEREIGGGNKTAIARLRAQMGPFILRRNKSEISNELPSLVEQDYLCPMTDRQEALYREEFANTRVRLDTGEVRKTHINMLTAIMRLRQIACDPRLAGTVGYKHDDSGKILAMRDILSECVDGGHRVLIFSQFTDMLFLIKDALTEDKIPFEYLDGQTKHRMEVVDKFQKDPNITAFLISLKAGGVGLNITGADTVIIFDPWWNPAVEDQAVSRAHRIGQTKSVNVYRLISEGTIEEKVTALKVRKAKLASDVLSDETSFEKSITAEDLAVLLES